MRKPRQGGRDGARRALSIALLVASTVASAAHADELSGVARQLGSAPDFRVRASAALALGRSHDERSLAPLIKALDDRHPAVRAAAAAGLAATGRVEGMPALRRRSARERAPAVRSQISAAVETLEKAAPAPPARAPHVLVKLGQLQNLSGVRGPQLSAVFRGATRAKASALPGVELLSESTDVPAAGAPREVPLLLLDGVVIRLAKSNDGEHLTVSAQVEYVFRKSPEHALRASFTGAARAVGGPRRPAEPVNAVRVALLEDQALQGAVESAMRAAPEVMLQALRSEDVR